MQALLEHFLSGIDKLVYIVKYVLEAFFLGRVAKVDRFSVPVLLLGEEVAATLLQIHSSFLFEAHLLPEVRRFVYADEVWERDVARLLVKVLATILQVQVVFAVLLEHLALVCVFLQVLLGVLEATELVHADHRQVLQAARQVHVLLNFLYDLVLCFRQCRLLRFAGA